MGISLFSFILMNPPSVPPSKHRLHNNGDEVSPCLTPLRISISTLLQFLALLSVLLFLYILPIRSISGAEIPFLTRHGFIAEWGTISDALEMSTIV
jgi:hypothetical protein